MVLVPAATFTMGSPADEPGRVPEETQHQVALTRAFYVSATEVTQAAWEYACRVYFPPAKHFTFVGLRLARTAP